MKLTTGQSKSISIHALREEGDLAALTAELEENHFYPRPPRGGRPKKLSAGQGPENFYPRPPRGGRRGGLQPGRDRQGISIHALREEGDLISLSIVMAAEIFLSTPSARRATTLAFNFTDSCEISIHALREEGDQPESDQPERNPYFYPRPPRGGRHEKGKGSPYARRISIHALREEGDGKIYALIPHTAKFLSTPSARRATAILVLGISSDTLFLSTPSARRATSWLRKWAVRFRNFYPRPPRGGRPKQAVPLCLRLTISIHALREEGDIISIDNNIDSADISIHALREEGDRSRSVMFRPL